jgi:ankyrin repeat protein
MSEYPLLSLLCLDGLSEESLGQQLLVAAWRDNGAEVDVLLAYGAPLRWENRSGETALHASVARHNPPGCLAKLLALGLSTEAITKRGCTPLAFAAKFGSVEAVHLLLASGAEPNAKDCLGRPVLFYALQRPAVVEALLERGAQPNEVFLEGKSLLFCAAANGAVRVLELLVRAGAEVNSKDAEGHTPLSAALCAKNDACVAALLEAGAQLNSNSRAAAVDALNARVARCSRMCDLAQRAAQDAREICFSRWSERIRPRETCVALFAVGIARYHKCNAAEIFWEAARASAEKTLAIIQFN